MTSVPRSDNAAYMRQYRARFGGSAPSDKARSRANEAAARWVLHNMPELYGNLMAEARAYYGLGLDIGPSGQFKKSPNPVTRNIPPTRGDTP